MDIKLSKVNVELVAEPSIIDRKGTVLQLDGSTIITNTIIQNAIIEANPYLQVFDCSVTLVNCKVKEFSTAWFGAKRTGIDNYIQLQKAIDTCISNNIPNLYVADSYSYSQSLKIYSLYRGLYVGANLNIYGDGDMWSDRTVLTYTGTAFAIGFQMAKGGSLSRLKIIGNYSPSFVTGAAYYSTDFPIRGGHYGLAIDYDGTNNTGGSTALRVENVWVEGFDTCYAVSPNGVTFNADCLTFTNIRVGNSRIGFQSNQAQEKGNQINNIVAWGKTQILIQIGKSGKFQAGQYIVRNGNIAGGVVQLFDISCSGWNGFAVDGLTAESLGRIGTIYAATSSYNPSVNLDKLYIRFALKTQAGIQNLLTSNSQSIKISNSNLWYYGVAGETMAFSGSAIFQNVNLGLSTYINASILNIK